MDQSVEAAKFRFGLLHRAFDEWLIGDAARKRERPAGSRRLPQPRLVEIDQRQPCAFLSKQKRRGAADAGRRAGDDDAAPFQGLFARLSEVRHYVLSNSSRS